MAWNKKRASEAMVSAAISMYDVVCMQRLTEPRNALEAEQVFHNGAAMMTAGFALMRVSRLIVHDSLTAEEAAAAERAVSDLQQIRAAIADLIASQRVNTESEAAKHATKVEMQVSQASGALQWALEAFEMGAID